jgi:hypothetical protein
LEETITEVEAVLAVVASIEVVTGADSEAEDLLLVVDEADSADEMTGAHVRCLKLPAVTAEKIVKYLLGQQTASRFTAVIVSKRWVMEEEKCPDVQTSRRPDNLTTMHNSKHSMLSWTK